MPRGKGDRCHGFLSSDGRLAHCTREDAAGGLAPHSASGTYAHRIDGPCDCGTTHGASSDRVRAARAAGRVLHEADFERCPHPYPCDYVDESGKVRYRVARWRKKDGDKSYSVHMPKSNGEWLPGRGDAQRVLYRLPETLAAVAQGETVHVAEGEKKVHALLRLGLYATCNDGGAGKFSREHADSLRGGQRVVVWTDSDEPGKAHAELVARLLHVAGISDIRLPVVSGLGDGEGIDDWLGRWTGTAEAARAELELLAETAAPWRSTVVSAAGTQSRGRSKSRRSALQGTSLELDDVDPCPEAVDGPTLFAEVAITTARYVVLPPHAGATITLWVALTYLTDAVEVLPRLLLTSPTRACGKSQLLTVLGALVRRPLPASSITPSAIFRAIASAEPTLLLDEMDNARFNQNPELRAVVNSGHTRGSAWTVRNVGEQHEPHKFSTWAPIALACIGRLPDTVTSRCVRVAMRRRLPSEALSRLRESRLKGDVEPLCRRLARWCRDHAAAISEAEPQLPDALGDRDADNWRPLFAIAGAVGGDWAEQARRAALALSGAVAEEAPGVLLLADLWDVFRARGTDRLSSEDIVGALVRLETRPWPEWRDGRPLAQRGLAHLLKPFGIEPRSVRFGNGVSRGYHREQFEDAWSRYLPPNPLQALQAATGAGPESILHPLHGSPVTDGEGASDSHEQCSVTQVTDVRPGERADALPPGGSGTGAPEPETRCAACGGRLLTWGSVQVCTDCHKKFSPCDGGEPDSQLAHQGGEASGRE